MKNKLKLPFKECRVVKGECLKTSHLRLHLRTIRVADGNIHTSNLAKLLKDPLKDVFTGLCIVHILLVAGTEPGDRQVGEVDRVWAFSRLHLVHVACIPEERIPVMTSRKIVLHLGRSQAHTFTNPGQLDRGAVQAV